MSDSASLAKLTRVIEDGIRLPSLPSAGAELIRMTHQPTEEIDLARLSKLVESDPGLSAHMLKIANSPYFGITKEVTTVRHGVALIGLRETVSELYFYLVVRTMPILPNLSFFSGEDFWSHSWACATAARMLGRTEYLVHSLPGDLYSAGLLHDIGKVLLALNLPEQFQQCLRVAHDEQIPLHSVEREILGVDHAVLGSHLLEAWNLPRKILAAVAAHHDPGDASPDLQEIAGLTQFADLIAHTSGVGDSGAPFMLPASETWIVAQGKTALSQDDARERIVEQIGAKLDKRGDVLLKEDSEGAEEQGKAGGGPVSEVRRKRDDDQPRRKAPPKTGWERFMDKLRSLFAV